MTLQFQFRTEPSASWSALGPDVPSRPYYLKWNTTASGWSDGDTVWVRAAAMSADCDTTYSLPVRLTIKRSGADIEENQSAAHEKKEKIESGRKVSFALAARLTIDIPAGLLDTDAHLKAADFTENPVGRTPERLAGAAGILYQKLEFENGPAHFRDSVILRFVYPDADQNGVIDGTDVPETTARVYWMGAADTAWRSVDTASVNPDSNVITSSVSHFSYYAVFGSSASALAGVGYPRSCVMTRFLRRVPAVADALRSLRDRVLETAAGRRLTALYYGG